MSNVPPPGSYVITPEIMWKTIEEARAAARNAEAAANRLADKLDPALDQIRKDIAELDKREKENHEGHDTRLVKVEESSWSSKWVPPLLTSVLVAILIAIVIPAITNAIQR